MRLLLVDDDQHSLMSTSRILERDGFEVVTCTDGAQAMQTIQEQGQNLSFMITDVRMPKLSGLELVQLLKNKKIELPFLVMTAYGSVQDAVWAMKMGAVDFLQKPFSRQDLLKSIKPLKERTQKNIPQMRFVGNSISSKNFEISLQQIAKTNATVLVCGESGTGKELVAKEIHAKSDFSAGPFVAINCAAIPESLIESELFGYKKGAFTGALQDKTGIFESAEGGTLFLDEVAELPLGMQAKLLRALENRKIRKVGSNDEIDINVRVVAATHKNLKQIVDQGLFRADLYYRLDVLSIQVPALRDRKEELPELIQFYLDYFNKERHCHVLLEESAQQALLNYPWPGNIRELRNAMERAVVLAQGQDGNGQIQVEHLPLSVVQSMETYLAKVAAFGSEKADGSEKPASTVEIPLGTSLKQVEDLLIENALKANQGDRAKAAKALGVNERTIYRWLKAKNSGSESLSSDLGPVQN